MLRKNIACAMLLTDARLYIIIVVLPQSFWLTGRRREVVGKELLTVVLLAVNL